MNVEVTEEEQTVLGRTQLLLAIVSRVSLVSDPVETHDHIFVPSKKSFEMRPRLG
jgi:hypothetical protein